MIASGVVVLPVLPGISVICLIESCFNCVANKFETVSNIKSQNFRTPVYHVETPGYYNWLPQP